MIKICNYVAVCVMLLLCLQLLQRLYLCPITKPPVVEENSELCISTDAPSIEQVAISVCTPPIEEPVVKTEEPVEEKWYTDDEYDLVCKVVMAEVGTEKADEYVNLDALQQEVTQVILNRVASESFPNTVTDVLYQANQYSCINNLEYYEEPTDRVKQNVLIVFDSNEPVCPTDVVWQAQFKQSAYGTNVKVYKEYDVGDTTIYLCHFGE